jgi:hypothetical protein
VRNKLYNILSLCIIDHKWKHWWCYWEEFFSVIDHKFEVLVLLRKNNSVIDDQHWSIGSHSEFLCIIISHKNWIEVWVALLRSFLSLITNWRMGAGWEVFIVYEECVSTLSSSMLSSYAAMPIIPDDILGSLQTWVNLQCSHKNTWWVSPHVPSQVHFEWRKWVVRWKNLKHGWLTDCRYLDMVEFLWVQNRN